MARSPLGKFSNFMVRTAKFFAKLAIYFVIMYFVGGILFKQGYKLFYEYAVDPEDDTQVEFTIADGDTLEQVTNKLYNAGLIDNKKTFKFMSLIYDDKFKILNMIPIIFFEKVKDRQLFTPGTYTLSKSMTQRKMIDAFENATGGLVSNINETTSDTGDFQLSPEGDDIVNTVDNE